MWWDKGVTLVVAVVVAGVVAVIGKRAGARLHRVGGQVVGRMDKGVLQRACHLLEGHVGGDCDEGERRPDPPRRVVAGAVGAAVGKVREDEREEHREEEEVGRDRLLVGPWERDVLHLARLPKAEHPVGEQLVVAREHRRVGAETSLPREGGDCEVTVR